MFKIKQNKYCQNLDQKGVSLVEVILVILLIGMVFLLFANLPAAFTAVSVGSREGKAKEILVKKVETVRSLGYENLVNGTTSIVDPRLSALPSGAGQMTVIDCPALVCTNGETIKQVDVQVTWSEKGKPKIVKMTTLVAQDGLK